MASFTSFGQVIAVLGQYLGFPGTISRAGTPVIKSRQVLTTTTHNVSFGEAVVVIPDAVGGTYQSIRDFVATLANIPALLVAQFAGIAVRNVKTQLTYGNGVTPGTQQTGYYAPGQMADALLLGSVVVPITHGTPAAEGPVYARVAANATLTATSVGDLEAAADVAATTTGTAASGTTLAVASPTGIVAGQLVTSAGYITPGTYVVSIASSNVLLSQAVIQAMSTTAVTFTSTVALPDVVFTTGVLDANGMAEITILRRRQA
jgi:hypothetical protein